MSDENSEAGLMYQKAIQINEMYESFVAAGFTAQQALHLVTEITKAEIAAAANDPDEDA